MCGAQVKWEASSGWWGMTSRAESVRLFHLGEGKAADLHCVLQKLEIFLRELSNELSI